VRVQVSCSAREIANYKLTFQLKRPKSAIHGCPQQSVEAFRAQSDPVAVYTLGSGASP